MRRRRADEGLMATDGPGPLPYDAPIEAYARQAEILLSALDAHERPAEWRVKWEHSRFRGKDVADVRRASLDLDDARLVVAQEHAFDTWADLAAFVEEMARGGRARRFEAAVEAV